MYIKEEHKMTIYEIVDMERNTVIYCDLYDKAAEVAAAIAYNKYYDCNVTMARLVDIFVKDMEYRTICIKKIYTI